LAFWAGVARPVTTLREYLSSLTVTGGPLFPYDGLFLLTAWVIGIIIYCHFIITCAFLKHLHFFTKSTNDVSFSVTVMFCFISVYSCTREFHCNLSMCIYCTSSNPPPPLRFLLPSHAFKNTFNRFHYSSFIYVYKIL
jgi:hypothetical protein